MLDGLRYELRVAEQFVDVAHCAALVRVVEVLRGRLDARDALGLHHTRKVLGRHVVRDAPRVLEVLDELLVVHGHRLGLDGALHLGEEEVGLQGHVELQLLAHVDTHRIRPIPHALGELARDLACAGATDSLVDLLAEEVLLKLAKQLEAELVLHLEHLLDVHEELHVLLLDPALRRQELLHVVRVHDLADVLLDLRLALGADAKDAREMGLSQRVALLLPRRAARLERRDRELAVHLLEHLLLGHALGVHAVRVRGRVRGLVGRALPEIVALVEVDHVDDLQHHVGARLEAERAAALLRDQVLALVLAGLLSELLLVEHRALELREELVHHRLEARLDRVVEEGPLVVLAEEQPVGELGEAGVVVGVDHARAARAHGLLDRLHVGARARDTVHLLALLERQVEELAHLVEQRALLEGHDLAATRAGRELVLVELGRHLLVDLGWDLQLRHERLVRLLGVLAKVVRRDALGEARAEHGAADLVVDRDGLLRGHAQELAHNGHGILVVVIRPLVERVGEEEAVGGGEVGLFHGLKVEPTLEGVARRGVLRERAGGNELVEEDLGGLLGVHHILQAGHGTLGVVEAHETDRLLERLVDHILNKREDDRASGLRRHGKLLLTGHQRADGAVERIGIIIDRLEDLSEPRGAGRGREARGVCPRGGGGKKGARTSC
mmetsp:Transcript_27401/g.74303  ORF Transcript_27401/g.74303 Transcript_27401/m.74303 type:complete len:671 (-) Transcript_27401:1396-3408(-)